MRLYLSSYLFGDEINKFRKMAPQNKKLALISNALDCYGYNERRHRNEQNHLSEFKKMGFEPQILDLQLYFAEHESLREKVKEFGSFWVTGGNAFGLRLCMNLSGFDTILLEMYEKKADVLYGGYSAGICILGNDLRGIEIMDEVDVHPYGEIDFIWEGIGILDYTIIPHVDSDHLESELATKVVEYMIKNNLPFKPLRDRETIIISE